MKHRPRRKHHKRPAVSRSTARGGGRVRRSGSHKTTAPAPATVRRPRSAPFSPKPKGGWMRVGDFVKQYFAHLPKRYRSKVALSQSSLPDPKLFVHPATGYVSAVKKFPKKKLCGRVEHFFSGYHFIYGGKPYKAEKKVLIRDKRGRKRTVRRIVSVMPKSEETVTVERTSAGYRNRFSPHVFSYAAVKRDLLDTVSKKFKIKSRSKRDTLEIFVVLEMLFWMFVGN